MHTFVHDHVYYEPLDESTFYALYTKLQVGTHPGYTASLSRDTFYFDHRPRFNYCAT
ncbi:hypothetical protein RSAG8_08066, partial [Rhizoctonia solani AG-8 WAC10335]